ncbi:MAG: PEP/pyruvate-binding domain-containing protein [Candidatus Woesearchaeota archaeon]|nr:PEP/pyruvate-binding domain-containing protein [Candidatus Woesearchaeota archaeon]
MPNIKLFKDIRKEDIPIVGGKAANLGELASMGLPVPDGFVITARAYERFVTEAGINEKIHKLLKALDVENTGQLNKTAEKVRGLIMKSRMPKALIEDIKKEYSRMNDFVAVRSSATAEDLPDASFAGQQETFLNVKGEKEVLEAVQKCFASLFTPRAIYYRVRNNFPHENVFLAVVVQKMVNADKAGVIFSINPVTQNKEEIIIEGAYGLGEAVVLGALTPHSYVIDKKTHKVKNKSISKLEWGYYRSKSGKTEKRNISHGHIEVLNENEAKGLVKFTKEIEKHYSIPMDIEWAIEGGKIYILQARPVTALR